jgi:hypothetical protein
MRTIVIRGVRISVPDRLVKHRDGVRFISGVMYVPNEASTQFYSKQFFTPVAPKTTNLFSLQAAAYKLSSHLGDQATLEEALLWLRTGKKVPDDASPSKEKQKPKPKWRKATKEECTRYNRIEGQLARRCLGLYRDKVRDLVRSMRSNHLYLTKILAQCQAREKELKIMKADLQKTIEALKASPSKGK